MVEVIEELTILAFNPPRGGRADETAPAETLVYTS
jgi:hypothetical protein